MQEGKLELASTENLQCS